MPVVSNIMFKLLGKVKLNLYIRFFCLLCASFMAANALAHDLSGWSDKTICRLIDEKHSSLLTQLLQEKITRRLICNNGRIAGYTSPTAASSEPTSDTKTSSVCSLNNLNGCINEAVCANASIKINGARKWEERPLYFKYVVEAKKRGLSCGVGSSSSTTKTTSACSSDNLNVCSNALVCGQGSRYINGKRIWDERSQHIKYSVEAKKRGLSCGVGSSSSTTKTSSVCSLNNLNGCINEAVCANASIKINGARKWEERPLYFKYVVEAKKRGLSCGVGSSSSTTKTTSACSSDNLNVCSNALVCGQGSRYINGKRIWDERSQHIKYSVEAKKRGLSCGVGSSSSTTKTSSVCSLNNLNGCSNNIVCQRGSRLFNGKLIWDERSPWIKYSIEAKKRGLSCGVFSVAAADLPNCSSDTNVRRHNCFGTFTFPSGEKYVGGFKSDKYDGQGTFTFSSGEKYVGGFKNNKYDGQGTLTFPSGEKYVGGFKNSKRNGQGTFTFPSGEKYVGGFKNDKYDGQGTLTFPSGEKYVGGFKNSKRNGQGTFTFPSGEKYVGGFKNDKYDGQGTLTYADGSVKDGLWKDDRFQYVNKTPIKEAVKIVANKDSSLGWIVFWLAVVGGLIFINLRASNRKQQEFLQQQKNERASKKTEDEKRHRAEQDKAEREAAAKERDRKSKESRDREALALAEKEEKTKASQEGDDESPIDKWLL